MKYLIRGIEKKESEGYTTYVIPHNWKDLFPIKGGWGNGYCTIPPGHPYYGKSYEKIPVVVHGGLTYGNFITRARIDHSNKAGAEPPLKDNLIGQYVVGFDTLRLGDNEHDQNLDWLLTETIKLRDQLIALDTRIFSPTTYKSYYNAPIKISN